MRPQRLIPLGLFISSAFFGYFLWTLPINTSTVAPALSADTKSSISPGSAKRFFGVSDENSGDDKPSVALTTETTWPPSTQIKLHILQQIFTRQNDNDPRLDNELRHLTSEDKKALQSLYQSLPTESRNHRGTVIFLLGRNLNQTADYDFFKTVLLEAPCRSLENCQKETPPTHADDEDHLGNGLALVLDYPQLMALKSLQKYPATEETLQDSERELLQIAQNSRSRGISDLARQILQASK